MTSARHIFASLAVLALTAGAAHAQLRPHMNLDEVFAAADVAFAGRVVALENRPHASGRLASTRVRFRVEDLFFDRTGSVGATIDLDFAGGTLGENRVEVCCVPRFALGDEAVLFVRHDGVRHLNPVVAHTGLLRLVTDPGTGQRFPLAAGRGLFLGPKGEFRRTEVVTGFAQSRPLYRAEGAPSPVGRGVAPTPVAGTGARSAADGRRAPRPDSVLSVETFGARIEQMERERLERLEQGTTEEQQ